jgi:hypothetical protein
VFRVNKSIKEIMAASVLTEKNEMSITFKKIFSIKEYETETLVIDCNIDVTNMNTEEARLAALLMQARMEYQVYLAGLVKGRISKEDFEKFKKEWEDIVNAYLKSNGGKIREQYIKI